MNTTSLRGLFGAVALVVLGAVTTIGTAPPAVTKAEYERWKTELSNWGRWGKTDEIGTLNLITPAKRKQAAALAKEGFVVSLAASLDTVKAPDNPQPFEFKMLGVGSDRLGFNYHGWSHTHLDALAHVSFDGKMYNGYTPDEATVIKANGHAKSSIHNLKNGLVTRGILMDIPRLKGVKYLEPGTPIYPEDLDAWEKKAGVKVMPGDALLVHTGRWSARKALGTVIVGRVGKAAGLDASVIPWLRKRDIALLGGDNAQSVAPSDFPGAVHDFVQVMLGVHVLDNADFDALAEAAAARNRWEFMLTIAPLAIIGGTGSPVNPIAMF